MSSTVFVFPSSPISLCPSEPSRGNTHSLALSELTWVRTLNRQLTALPQNLGNKLGPHLVLHLLGPHLQVAQVMWSRLLAQQNLVKLLLQLIGTQLQIEVHPGGWYPQGPGNNRHMGALMEMEGVVTLFGRIAMLIDQNTQAFHMFISAMLQLFDRSGLLYGELARFVMRLLGIRTKPKKVQPPGYGLPLGPDSHNPHGHGVQNFIEGPKAAPSGSWDIVWGNGAGN